MWAKSISLDSWMRKQAEQSGRSVRQLPMRSELRGDVTGILLASELAFAGRRFAATRGGKDQLCRH